MILQPKRTAALAITGVGLSLLVILTVLLWRGQGHWFSDAPTWLEGRTLVIVWTVILVLFRGLVAVLELRQFRQKTSILSEFIDALYFFVLTAAILIVFVVPDAAPTGHAFSAVFVPADPYGIFKLGLAVVFITLSAISLFSAGRTLYRALQKSYQRQSLKPQIIRHVARTSTGDEA